MRSEPDVAAVVILFLYPTYAAHFVAAFSGMHLSAAFYCPRRRRNNSVKCARFLLATFYRFRILSLSNSAAHSAQLWSRVCVAALRILEINAACSAAQFLRRGRPEEANFNHRYYSLGAYSGWN
jgi:hypothetical protein